jgi:single-stranded DNA-binding protein
MAMSMNKVFISGRMKGDPYEVAGRHRQFTRFRVQLPRERNRRRGDPDSVLVEAVGRNGARIVQTLKDGAFLTLEGRLRTTVVADGEHKQATILVRLENFSINLPPADNEDDGNQVETQEDSARKPRRRNRRGRKNEEGTPNSGRQQRQRSENQDSPNRSPRKGDGATESTFPKADRSAPAAEKTSESTAPEIALEKTEVKTPDQSVEVKKSVESTKAKEPVQPVAKPASPPEMPRIKSVAEDSLKGDMPF